MRSYVARAFIRAVSIFSKVTRMPMASFVTFPVDDDTGGTAGCIMSLGTSQSVSIAYIVLKEARANLAKDADPDDVEMLSQLGSVLGVLHGMVSPRTVLREDVGKHSD